VKHFSASIYVGWYTFTPRVVLSEIGR